MKHTYITTEIKRKMVRFGTTNLNNFSIKIILYKEKDITTIIYKDMEFR